MYTIIYNSIWGKNGTWKIRSREIFAVSQITQKQTQLNKKHNKENQSGNEY
jgi:hypothetical protein